MALTITKIFHYEMAHALHNYSGACANIHGHSYRLEVTVTGEPITDSNHPQYGMILDFSDLKRIVETTVIQTVDHSLVLHKNTDAALLQTLRKHYANIVIVDYQPTSENLLIDFANRIAPLLPQHVRLHKIRMYETNSSYAELTLSDKC